MNTRTIVLIKSLKEKLEEICSTFQEITEANSKNISDVVKIDDIIYHIGVAIERLEDINE